MKEWIAEEDESEPKERERKTGGGHNKPTSMDPIPCRSQVLGVASLGDEVRPILGGIRRVAAKIALVPRVNLQGC